MNDKFKKTNVDLCVCCGNVIPEGVMVCYECKEKNIKKETKTKKANKNFK